MTPLMHAAYKGKASICDLLLKNGADVNCNKHEHQVRSFKKELKNRIIYYEYF